MLTMELDGSTSHYICADGLPKCQSHCLSGCLSKSPAVLKRALLPLFALLGMAALGLTEARAEQGLAPSQIKAQAEAQIGGQIEDQRAVPADGDRQKSRPNIVLLLVDDAGFMDFSSYGGEAQTRTIDALGANGVRFSNYHTTPLCAPSRAMLLTGMDSHRTGIGTIPEMLTPDQHGHHAYALKLQPGVKTLADHLQRSGYRTLMTGKWHLGRGDGDLPNDHGFDRSFVLDASGADNWEQKPYMPFYHEAPWFEDGQPADLPPHFYSSEFLVDQMIGYIEEADTDLPFFAFIGFQAIHIPIQAPRQFTDRYVGVYRDGWAVAKQRRIQKARALGFIPPDAPDPATPPHTRRWEDLSAQDQAHMERRMMVNAGMLEAMDFHIGRLVDHLKASGQFDNTIFIVTSDNGPEYGDPASDPSFRLWMRFNGYHDDFATLGEKGSMAAIGPEWASTAAAPGALFKMYASQGGMRVPLIMSGPGISRRGIVPAMSFVSDVTPTLLNLVGLASPEGLDGRSLLPALTGKSDAIYGPDDAIGIEVAGNSALFKGRYKLTRNSLPYGDAQWRLHDIEADPGEQVDLSSTHPDLREEMMGAYNAYAARVGVVALPADFNLFEQISANTYSKIRMRVQSAVFGIAGAVALMLVLLVMVRRVRRRRTAA